MLKQDRYAPTAGFTVNCYRAGVQDDSFRQNTERILAVMGFQVSKLFGVQIHGGHESSR